MRAVAAMTKTHEDFYVLNGVRYNVTQVISERTGEAQVLMVENGGNQYVLKLYYVDYHPNHAILDKVMKARGAGLLVGVVAHGVWSPADNGIEVSPGVAAEKRDYELMDYYSGGTLDEIKINGDEMLLTKYITQMASAIDFCHKHQFLHRDIKPSNFLFRDKTHTQLVLTDFGIAVDCDAQGQAKCNIARTKIYAAPEMYFQTGNGIVDASTKSDFFSMGITILCLWMGEEEFSKSVAANELAFAKLKDRGKLPYPTDMSPHLLSLVKALTEPEPERRPDFETIKQWIRGEDPFAAQTATVEEETMSITFNSSKGLVAHSLEDLAKFMMDDPQLGIQYLYRGQLNQWLRDANIPEVNVQISHIAEDLYPKANQHNAGLHAACYTLDPAMPYYDVQKNPLTSVPEIAASLLQNIEVYEDELMDENNPLYVFFNMHGLADIVSTTQKDFQQLTAHEATLKLLYTLDPKLPYILRDQRGGVHYCNTPDDVIKVKYEHSLDDDSWEGLTSDSFLIWLAERDKSLVGRVRKAVSDPKINHGMAPMAVLYALNPKVSYTLCLDEKDPNYVFTHQQIAQLINYWMDTYLANKQDDAWRTANYSLSDLSKIDGTQLYCYLKSKGGVYDHWLDWIRYCADLKSKDNTEKYAPYNWYIAAYKIMKGMGIEPYYRFPRCGKQVTSPSELDQIPSGEVVQELQSGHLADWLAVFYQEDPRLDKSQKYAFERATEQYVEDIHRRDPQNNMVQPYFAAANQVTKTSADLRKTHRSLVILRTLVGVFCLLPIAGLIAMLLINGLPFTENPMPGFSSSIVVLGVICTVLVFALAEGEGGCIGAAIWGFIIGAILYYAIYFILELIIPIAPYLAVGLLLLLGWFIYNTCYRKLPLNTAANKDLLNPGFEETVLEPLHYAFRNTRGGFDSSILDRSTQYLNDLTTARGTLLKRAIPTIIGTVLLLGFFVNYTYGDNFFHLPSWSSGKSSEKTEAMTTLIGQWNGTFDGRPCTIDIQSVSEDNTLSGVIYVKYRSLLQEKFVGRADPSTGTLMLDDLVTNNKLDGTYKGDITEEDGVQVITGTYTNKKSGYQAPFVVRLASGVTLTPSSDTSTSTTTTKKSSAKTSTKSGEQPKSSSGEGVRVSAEEAKPSNLMKKAEQQSEDQSSGGGYHFEPADEPASGGGGGGGYHFEPVDE